MRRLGLGLMLLGSAVMAHAAQPEEDFSTPRLDLSTVQFAHPDSYFLPSYRFSASVMLTRPADSVPVGSNFGSIYKLSTAEPPQKLAQVTSPRWPQTAGGDRVSLPQLLRIEFKGEQFKFTLQPQSASLEGERYKITFRSQSVWVVWRKNLY